MTPVRRTPPRRRPLRHLLVVLGAAGLTLALFLVLPLIEAIGDAPKDILELQTVDTVNLPPPPPPEPEEPEPEREPEEPPPQLQEEVAPLDLSQLELALNPGDGGGWMSGDFGVKLGAIGAGGGDTDALFTLDELDEAPRATYQPQPVLEAQLRRKSGAVTIIFICDQRGRVENPIVKSSTDPVFERPALAAVKKWRFEPGKRGGKPVRSRMRVPMTFK